MLKLDFLKNIVHSPEVDNPLEIPYILDLIHKVRGTFQQDFPLNTKSGRDFYLAWWMCYGLPEYNFIHHFISEHNISYLNEPVSQENPELLNKYNFFYNLVIKTNELDDTPHDNNSRKLEIWYHLIVVPTYNIFWLEGDERIAKLTRKDQNGYSNLDYMVIDYFRLFKNEDGDGDATSLLEKGKARFALEHYYLKTFNKYNDTPIKDKNNPNIGFNIIGLIGCNSGVGEDSRMAAACLETIDENYKFVSFQNIANEELPYDTNLFCLTGFQTILTLASGGESVFNDRYNIGYFPWELPEWPHDLIPALEIVDEIWVASQFIKDSITPFTNKLVTVIPLAVQIPNFKKRPKEYFNIPNDSFTFLYTFDFISGFERKNVLNTLKYFRDAFLDGDEKVTFFLKSRNFSPNINGVHEILEIIENDPRIIHFQNDMTREELTSLTACCDSFLSIHRAEGFGRCIAEAIILNRYVITTNYSGNLVFCNEKNCILIDYAPIPVNARDYVFSFNQTWADPDKEKTISALKKAYENHCSNIKVSFEFRQTEEFLSPKNIGQLYRNRIISFRGN